MRITLLLLCFIVPLFGMGQRTLNGKITSNNGEPLAFAEILVKNQIVALSNIEGYFSVEIPLDTKRFKVSYLGYVTKNVSVEKDENVYDVTLKPSNEALKEVLITSNTRAAQRIIQKAIDAKSVNNPNEALTSYEFDAYNKFIIDNSGFSIENDSANFEVEKLINSSRAYLSEKVSTYQYTKKKGLKETIKGTQTAGFEQPVYELLSLQLQSLSWYDEDYTIFDTDYAGPLSKRPFNNYSYKILDTTATSQPAYIIYFKPKRQRAVAGLEGVLYLDTTSFAIQKAIGQLNGVVKIESSQEFEFFAEDNIWFPKNAEVTIKPGIGGQSISIFGGNISVGQLQRKRVRDNDSISGIDTDDLYLESKSVFSNIQLNKDLDLSRGDFAITIKNDAISKPESFWKSYRIAPLDERDLRTTERVDSIIKAENIERRIDVIQNFNEGYYPIGFWDVDLRTLVKYNNYEGMRLGTGGITNNKFSNRFRVEGYGVYGFGDHTFKYSLGGGALLRKESSTWLNLNYTSDVTEVGSFFYLTDKLAYSLFEPRLVNIDFYYIHRTWRASLQHRFTPKILTETMLSRSNISQTDGYVFLDNNTLFNNYRITSATFSVRWSPFSKFLKGPGKVVEFEDNYPKFSAQVVQSFEGLLDGDFDFTKIGAKIDYQISRLNQSHTSILLEGDYSFGNIPLTHLFHAYPNAPTKETILQRFSVAGRRSFETMYFSEFYSDRLATLQVRHTLRPIKFSQRFKPEVVLISRHAIGNSSNQANHNRSYRTLEHGYNEAGLEVNKLFYGFGTSFAYRYGAYHLPSFGDNISFKFTFYLKL